MRNRHHPDRGTIPGVSKWLEFQHGFWPKQPICTDLIRFDQLFQPHPRFDSTPLRGWDCPSIGMMAIPRLRRFAATLGMTV